MFPWLQRNPLFALVFLAASVLAPQASSKTSYIPHISQGGGWSTAFHVVNLCATTSAYTVAFHDSAGDTLKLFSDGEEWSGFGDEELPAQGMQFAYFADEEEQRSGYAIVENDDGCVAVEVFHVQHYPDDGTWYVITQAQPTAGARSGVVIPFLNFEGCDSNIVIVGDAAGAASVEVFNTYGESLGKENIGNLFRVHENFMLGTKFPAAKGEYGTVHINGNVSAVGLTMCNGNLVESRLARPMPGSSGTSSSTGDLFEVVSFQAKHLRTLSFLGQEYSYRLTIRNPTDTDQIYDIALLFRGADGFVLKRKQILGYGRFSVSAGQTRTFEGTESQIYFSADPSTVTVDVEVTAR